MSLGIRYLEMDSSLTETAIKTQALTAHQIVIIDSRVTDYQTLINNLPTDSKWFLLDAEQDGITQIQSILANYSNLDAIQILSHGSQGSLYLGNTALSNDNIDSYSS